MISSISPTTCAIRPHLQNIPYHVLRFVADNLPRTGLFALRTTCKELNGIVSFIKRGDYTRVTRQFISRTPALASRSDAIESFLLAPLLESPPASMREMYSSIEMLRKSIAFLIASDCEDSYLSQLESDPEIINSDLLASGLTKEQSFILSTEQNVRHMTADAQKLRYLHSIIKLSRLMKRMKGNKDIQSLCREPLLYFGGIKKAIRLANMAKDINKPTLLFAQLWIRVHHIAFVDLDLAIYIARKLEVKNGFFQKACASTQRKSDVKDELHHSIVRTLCAWKRFEEALRFIQDEKLNLGADKKKALYNRLVGHLVQYLKTNPPTRSMYPLAENLNRTFLFPNDLFATADDESRVKGSFFLALLGMYEEAKALALKIDCADLQSESFENIMLVLVTRGAMEEGMAGAALCNLQDPAKIHETIALEFLKEDKINRTLKHLSLIPRKSLHRQPIYRALALWYSKQGDFHTSQAYMRRLTNLQWKQGVIKTMAADMAERGLHADSKRLLETVKEWLRDSDTPKFVSVEEDSSSSDGS